MNNLLVPLNLTSFMQGKYQLKRKAVDEDGAVSKRLRGTTEISVLLETEDLSAKLAIQNSMVAKIIECLEEIIWEGTSNTCGTTMEAWGKKIIGPLEKSCDEALKVRELCKQLSGLLNEYKSNKELEERSWSDATWRSDKWVGPISTCSNDLQIRVLGMQKLHEMIDEKRADIIGRADKLEQELKKLGVSFI